VKKTWALSLVLVIVSVVGFACSGDAATPTRPPTSTSPAPTATSPVMMEATATAPASTGEGDAALGQQLVTSRGCLGCHTTDGSALVGPSWKGLYGTTRPLADGSSVMVDAAYIKESISNPTAKIAQGFPPIMPPFTFSSDDLNAVVAFIESLK